VRLIIILIALHALSAHAFLSSGASGGGGSSYDQSLNTTDSVTFNAVTSTDAATIDGMYAGARNSGTWLGLSAGSVSQSGALLNTGVGDKALEDLTTGDSNTALGYRALGNNTTGGSNTAIGDEALLTNTDSTGSIAIGSRALKFYSGSAGNNVAMGTDALINLTTGQRNVVLGNGSGGQLTGGGSNTIVGVFAGPSITGNFNTVVGEEGLGACSSGSSNTAIGFFAGYSCGTSSGSVYIGAEAGSNNSTSNKLFIDNTNTATPLIGGDFSANTVTITGALSSTEGIGLNTATAKPTCNSSNRGKIWYTAGGAGVADAWEKCHKDAGDAYAWVAF
jgi:hypothetical protein